MKVLVIDKDPAVEEFLTHNFLSDKYTFLFASDSNSAINILRAEPDLSLVLLCIDPPSTNTSGVDTSGVDILDGFSLLSELPQFNPSLRAIAMSACTDLSSLRAAMNRGAFDFLAKPLHIGDLQSTLQRTGEHIREVREKRLITSMDELKSRFFDNITHEFRTPLTLILGPVEKLLREISDEGHRQKLLLVQRNARQLLRITNQLLDLARLETGHLAVHATPGNLGNYIEQLVVPFKSLADEKGLRLDFRCTLSNTYYFDAEKIEQIVHNLLANALKFTQVNSSSLAQNDIMIHVSPLDEAPPQLWTPLPGQGTPAVHTYSPHSQSCLVNRQGIRLLVKDSGIGIQPLRLPHIFDRFHMLNPKHFRPDVALVQPSTGIGLAFVKELTELMQGTITVSSAINQGTSFLIELPLCTATEEQIREAPPLASLPVLAWPDTPAQLVRAASNGEMPLVLVVEDESELRDFIADELTRHYQVLTAPDGKTGWALAQAELPDVVISDVAMPNMDGFQLTHHLKTHPTTDHIGVILLTSKTTEKDIITGLQQGADVYLPKPFHLEELHLRLRNLLTRQQKIQEHYRQQLAEPSLPAKTIQDKFLRNVYELIDQRIDDSTLNVESLAETLAISRKTLYRKIHGLTHLAPNELIRQYRLRKAADLLKSGHNASETAYMVGFETPSYFGQCFKEFYGLTPMEYVSQSSL